MIRTVEQWKEILASFADQPRGIAAMRIFGDITHYRHGGPYESSDCMQLGNALAAWAELVRETEGAPSA